MVEVNATQFTWDAMKRSILIGLFISSALLVTARLRATPLRLTVQPKSTNQVELTIEPVITNGYYEVLARTNGPKGHWIRFTGLLGNSNKIITTACDLSHIDGLTLNNLHNWTFVAGRWDDPLGDELPPLYKELVLRIDPFASGDPYGNPMGDGWNNLQKLQSDMDPLACYAPPAPRLSAAFRDMSTNGRYGTAVLTWEPLGGPVPDYFIVERANRTSRPRTNDARFMRPGPNGPSGNRPLNWPTNRSPNGRTNLPPNWNTNPSQRWPSNRSPNFPSGYGRPGFGVGMALETGPFVPVARVPGRIGLTQYHYVDTNVDILFQPLYRIAPHNLPPPRAYLKEWDTAAIRGTMTSVAAQETTSGYVLTVPHPIPCARYLLLVRDKNDPQWRASGYFESGTNLDDVYLHVDKKGMMSDGQKPISLPSVKFLPDVFEPEFTAGWGEDSDGDGLPDIYEILVMHTEPDNADTGNTGILDGFKETTNDGWNNLEKFRRRADPFKATHPPATTVLKQPTMAETMRAATPHSDLRYEPQIAVRVAGTADFLTIHEALWMLYRFSDPRDPYQVRGNFDLRISWAIPQEQPRISGGGP